MRGDAALKITLVWYDVDDVDVVDLGWHTGVFSQHQAAEKRMKKIKISVLNSVKIVLCSSDLGGAMHASLEHR